MTTYTYPANGAYNETVATLDDGRVLTVNTQYGVALPHGHHADGCSQVTKIGGRCDCGLLDGIDVDALVADARVRGLRGKPAKPVVTADERARRYAELDEVERSGRAVWRVMGVDPDVD